MRFSNLASWPVCAATLFTATVFAEPPDVHRMKPVKVESETVKVDGRSGCGHIPPHCAVYTAEVFDGINGERQGRIRVYYFNVADRFTQELSCFGPLYADMIKYDEKTLKFTLNVTLDPLKDPNCARPSWDAAVVINLAGGPNGTFRDSSTGRGTITTDTSKTKYKVENDLADGDATGTNGYFQGSYSARIEIMRRTERTKAED